MDRRFISVVFLLAAASAAFAVDWSTVTGDYTVPAGAEEVVTDADIGYINALTSLTVEGSVLFDSSVPPTTVLRGTGTCLKTNEADWVMAVAWSNWKGTWKFTGGRISYRCGQALGNNTVDAQGNPNSEVYFLDDATLDLDVTPNESWIYRQRVHIRGTGKKVDGKGLGAIRATAISSQSPGTQLGDIMLEGDATITARYFYYLTYGTLNLNGHTLDFEAPWETTSTARSLTFGPGSSVAGPGEIKMPGSVPLRVLGTDTFAFRESSPRIKVTVSGGDVKYERDKSATCDYPTQHVDFVVHGLSHLWHTHNSPAYIPTQPVDDCGITFVGDVTLPAATDTLYVCSWVSGSDTAHQPKCPIYLYGNLHGAGKVFLPDEKKGSSVGERYGLGALADDFSGSVTLKLGSGGLVRLQSPFSVPSAAELNVSGGYLAPAVGTDGGWTLSEIMRLMGEVNQSSRNVMALDASAAENGEAEIVATNWSENASSSCYLGASAGTVTLKGPIVGGTEKNFAAVGGTLRFAGEEPIVIDKAFSLTLNHESEPGVLRFDGASDVSLATNGVIYVPRAIEAEGNYLPAQERPGRMVVEDSTVSMALPPISDFEGNSGDLWTSSADRAVYLGVTMDGCSQPGVLEVGTGADLSAKVIAGYASDDVGAVFQSAGVMRQVGNFRNGSRSCGPVMGMSGHAAMTLSGGRLELEGRMSSTIGSTSTFVYRQTGGVCTNKQHRLDAQGWTRQVFFGDGYAHLCVEGGTMTLDDVCANERSISPAGSTMVVTVEGADTVFSCQRIYYSHGGANAAGSVIVNFNGGLAEFFSDGIRPKTEGTGAARAYVNFNGGLCRAAGFCWRFLYNARDIMCATVFSGGAKLDIQSANAYVQPPLCAPQGKGVVSIPVPEELANAKLLCAPAVQIAETGSGSGHGASAIALFDRATGKVTSIRVTSAGDGYEEATATITYGCGRSWTQVCTLGENDKTGGLLKTGSGNLSLFGANSTYRGATEVREGTLTCEADNALPAGGELKLTGGTVNLKDFAFAPSAVGGTSGKISSTTARTLNADAPLLGTTSALVFDKVTPAFTGVWTLSAADVVAGATAEYDTDVSFGDAAEVALTDVSALETEDAENGSPYVLLRVSEGKALTGLPRLTNAPANGRWLLKTNGRELRLVCKKGIVLIVR